MLKEVRIVVMRGGENDGGTVVVALPSECCLPVTLAELCAGQGRPSTGAFFSVYIIFP